MQITTSEKKILEVLRELKPFEYVTVHKDKQGKVDTFLVHREQKFVVNREEQ